MSHELSRAGVEHVVLEKHRVAETWRRRWDSFCLVTPNWSVLLPGHPYDGDDPDGFMSREEVVGYLERYSQGFRAPVQEGMEVTSLRPLSGCFALKTSAGELEARTVVLCTGAYQRPYRPAAAATLPPGLLQIDVEDYRNPQDLPPGAVLVVGSGQSGCQLAEELHEAGREVFLSCGRAGWASRRLGDRDLFWWLREVGDLDDLSSSLPSPDARLRANLQATGHGGGHDLHYRTLQALGVTLLGRFRGVEGRHALFAADLSESVAWADQRHEQFMDRVRKLVVERGLRRVKTPGVEQPSQLRNVSRLAAAMRPQPLISVTDVPRSSRWYQDLLGCESGHGGVEYERLVRDGRLALQLHHFAIEHHHGRIGDPELRPFGNGAALWFEIDDFDAALRRAEVLNVAVRAGAAPQPAPGPRRAGASRDLAA